MTLNEPRMASGEAEAKAAWDRATDDLYLGRLDRLDGVGTRTVVSMGDTPRLQTVTDFEPVSAAQPQPFVSILPVDPPKSKVFPFVLIVASLAGTLGLLLGYMGGAA